MFSQENASINLHQYINSTTDTICRLCLKQYSVNELETIFNSFENTTIAEYVIDFAKIPIAREDCFSKVVCKRCLKNLKEVDDFRKFLFNCNECLNHLYVVYSRITAENEAINVSGSMQNSGILGNINKIEEIEVKSEEDNNSLPAVKEEENKIDIVDHGIVEDISKIELDEIIRKPKKIQKRNPNLRFPCNYCERIFKSVAGRKAHLIVHTGKYHECGICHKKFLSKYVFMRHERTHTEGNLLECKECGKRYVSPHTLRNHLDTHSGAPKYQCDQCGKRFNLCTTFESHQRYHTLQMLEIKCEICNRTIRSRNPNAIKNHRKKHLENREKLCQECGKTFKSTEGFQAHLKNHTGQLEFKCSQCPKQYTSKRSLKDHTAAAHSTIKPFSCEICGKTFAVRTGWYIHGKVHAKENPFTCKICEKIFGYPSHLKGHLKVVHGSIGN